MLNLGISRFVIPGILYHQEHGDNLGLKSFLFLYLYHNYLLTSPRTRRALSPGYICVPGFRKCLELQTWKIPNGTSNTTGLCIPAAKPADCSEVAWANLISPFTKRSGIRSCQGGINPIGILQMRARPTFSPLKGKSWLLNHVIYLRNRDKISV